jgi:hypothetical protein
MSLAHFLIRGFPDPLTESLSFSNTLGDMLEDETIKKIL